MVKKSWLSGPGTRFEIIIENFDGRSYRMPLIRGPLWPEGDDPPAFGRERDDGVIETVKGDFGSTDQLASFFGCVVSYDEARSIEEN